jgi:hypothetical protein
MRKITNSVFNTTLGTLSTLGNCPDNLPEPLQQAARHLADTWIASECRPRPSPEVTLHWSRLIAEWVNSPSLPLYVRKHRGDRGSILQHTSGRALVPVDNSLSHWTFALALAGICPTLSEIQAYVERDEIPVAMIFKKEERINAKFKCDRSKYSLSARGWNVCHIRSVGLKDRADLISRPIARLLAHFRDLASPANMFLVPLAWQGFGEMPEMIEAARRAQPVLI